MTVRMEADSLLFLNQPCLTLALLTLCWMNRQINFAVCVRQDIIQPYKERVSDYIKIQENFKDIAHHKMNLLQCMVSLI